jgi:hypothetical protein
MDSIVLIVFGPVPVHEASFAILAVSPSLYAYASLALYHFSCVIACFSCEEDPTIKPQCSSVLILELLRLFGGLHISVLQLLAFGTTYFQTAPVTRILLLPFLQSPPSCSLVSEGTRATRNTDVSIESQMSKQERGKSMFPRGGADAGVSRMRVREEQQRQPHSVSAN